MRNKSNNKTQSDKYPKINNIDYIKPRIKSIDGYGKLTIIFSEDMMIPESLD